MSLKANYFPCRCTREKCKTRVTLRRHPESYKVTKVCPTCGSRLRVDAYRVKQRLLPGHLRKDNPMCYCAAAPGRDGQNMPHRVGSMKTCERYGVPF